MFKKALGSVFVGAGFTKKEQTWYLQGTDSVVGVNLQKSDFSEKYYLNLGIWIKRLGINDFPKVNHCHIQVRASGIFPESISLLDKSCSLEFASDADISELLVFLGDHMIPFCQDCLTGQGLKKHFRSGRFSNALVFKEVETLLKSEGETKDKPMFLKEKHGTVPVLFGNADDFDGSGLDC